MNEKELKFLKEAGQIAGTALQKGLKQIKEGESVRKILDEVEEYISQKGAVPAFPAQISINSTAAHYCPTEDEDIKIKENDLVKLDVGVAVEGYVADNARTKCPAGKHELINATDEALKNALKIINPETTLSDIGKTIQQTISSHGYSPVRNLSGHGVDRYEVHTYPTVPNYETGDDTELGEDLTIAIEPFASDGAGVVYESNNPTVFTLSEEKPVRSPMARKVLQEIKKFEGLPFTTRWLTRKLGKGPTLFGLRELRNKEMLQEHPPLIDKTKGLVSQSEHSIIVRDKPIIYTEVNE